MRHWLLLALLTLPVMGLAQPVPQILWEHDGVNVTRFECVVDGGTPVNLNLPTPVGSTYAVEVEACPALLVNGTHTLIIQACNDTTCVAATVLTVVKL